MGSHHDLRDNVFVEVRQHGEVCVRRLEEIWHHLYGKNESILANRYETIKLHLKGLLDEMVKEEEETLEENRRILSDLMKCRQTLQEELCMTITVPFDVDLAKPNIAKQVQKLTDIIKEYDLIKVNRLQKLVELKDKEEQLCDALGEEPRYVSVSTVPSEELLTEIKNYVTLLDAEKVRRSIKCDTLVNEIEALMNDLELDYDETEGKLALLNRSNSATLSNRRIAGLEEMKSEMDSLKENQIAEIDAVKEKVTLLWNLLDVDSAERDVVLRQTAKVYGRSVVNAWTRELERCEVLKTLNLRDIITKLRVVIKQLWDECHIGQEKRDDFVYFCCENYDEKLLEAHEEEHRRLCDYKIETKNVLDLAKKWFSLWDKMITMENRASSSTNRYANRGGQLLKEERERKLVQKELPKVETSLQKMIGELEQKTGARFKYDGRPLLEIIAEMWEKRRIEKENEKESRKTQNRATPSKPSSAVHTPASSLMKRGKILSAVENTSSKKPVTARRELKMPTSTRKEVRRRSRSHDSAMPQRKINEERNADFNDTTESYTGFQAYLENACKNGLQLRSSTSPNTPPTTPSSRKNRSADHSFHFKSPKNVAKRVPKKFFMSPSARRPMLH